MFSQKSMFGQLASSLDESLLRTAQVELQKFSRCIMEDAALLNAQTIESEARENNGFRALFRASRSADSHHRRLKKRLNLLDACSKLNFETPWKQTRKLGNSTIFANDETYKTWKRGEGPATLVLTGKLGSGKSVAMANIVDDLHLLGDGSTTVYFFCRHDTPETLTSRAVIGSLSRQLLQACADNPTYNRLFDDLDLAQQSFDPESISNIVRKMFPAGQRICCVIDGLDECPVYEALDTIRWISRLRSVFKLNLWCCRSIRMIANERMVAEDTEGGCASVSMVDSNPDIIDYVETEIRNRIATGQLKLGDHNLAVEIKDALIQGAKGMFLWVALQIQSLSEEQNDEAIRAALHDLPEDLYSTFEQILARCQARSKRNYQSSILKMIISASRPLTIFELQEALSVTPCDPEWHEDRLINDIRGIITCCGGLVVVDEEELSARLVHHSVGQFLRRGHSWDLDAQIFMGEVVVTYLSFPIFNTQVSTRVLPDVPAAQMTAKLLKDTLRRNNSLPEVQV
ncbi:hypothetical protein QBC34DRAFT_384997 [Podospora aff. communis PSN243]|uniref:NACHT domain-containing protein n=1 Tax=Podospora aff. communis PSN243 TaxID=3040156 RepID=A0AAV9G9L9_9PEZI|nr:hypothetical protein QBC34DRAFT_384997 [Podospora aff. communis PSN243]